MIYKVLEGAKLSCTLGSSQTTLQVPIPHGAILKGQNEATIQDNKVGMNILPFGSCAKSSPPIPCTPCFSMPWLLAKPMFKIKGQPGLTSNCILPCMCGGIVKIENAGQE